MMTPSIKDILSIHEYVKEVVNYIKKSWKGENVCIRYDRELGSLEKCKYKIPNVLLRVETFIKILEKLSNNGQALKNLGKEIGEDFAGSFINELAKDKKSLGDSKMVLKEWGAYDSKAGWGLIDLNNCLNSNGIFSGSINVTHSIFKKNYCDFLEGYFEGVISKLFQKKIKIEKTGNCDTCGVSDKRPSCSFIVKEIHI